MASYKVFNATPLWNGKKLKGSDLLFAHARSTCKHILCSFLEMVVFDICQIIIWWLTTAKNNFYQPVLRLDLLWLRHREDMAFFYDLQNIYPHNITEWQLDWSFSSWSHCKTMTYMTIIKLSDEGCIVNIDHNTDTCNAQIKIYLRNQMKQLSRGISSKSRSLVTVRGI